MQSFKKRIRAVAIIINNGSIVLIHRIKHGEEYYVFPGGGVEDNETIEEAVLREAKEETSLNIEIDKLLYHQIYSDNTEHYYFLCKNVSGNLKLGDFNEAKEMKKSEDNFYSPIWFDLSEINKLVLFPSSIRDFLLEDIKKDFKDEPKTYFVELKK